MLVWASSYYLLAVVADPIAAELSISPSLVFGIFSAVFAVELHLLGVAMSGRSGIGRG